MRNSNLLKWAQNKQNDKGGKNWIHQPDTLQKGHIAYLVKFLGNTEVDQPKGIEVVKEGIRKLTFNQQLKKSEGNNKIPKVELTISIDGVAIQEPKTKRIMHQYPLHMISYCADDKGEKKFFSFIAKDCVENSTEPERHTCFVFVSDKLAEEITLTIGQAFELAYKRFLETSGKELEVQRRVMVLQQRVQQLEAESSALRQRLSDVLSGQANDLDNYMRKNKITNMLVVESAVTTSDSNSHGHTNGSSNSSSDTNGLLLNLNEPEMGPSVPPVPPRSFERPFINDRPSVGTKLEGLLLDELDDDFNPRAFENQPQTVMPPVVQQNDQQQPQQHMTMGQMVFSSYNQTPNYQSLNNGNGAAPLLAPPPRANPSSNIGANSGNRSGNMIMTTTGGVTKPTTADPFGMGDFGSNDLEAAIGLLDKKILQMKDGFSRGLTFGNEDFSIESLDPLRK